MEGASRLHFFPASPVSALSKQPYMTSVSGNEHHDLIHLSHVRSCSPPPRYLVDYVTEADRKGHGADLAKHYAESELCKRNNTDLDR
jgi:hypothetical protein